MITWWKWNSWSPMRYAKSREQSLICYLWQLKTDHLIDDYTFQKVLPKSSTHGVLYGPPKVHKTGCPFCPIVSSTNTYNYNLASYLVNVLQPISTNCFSVEDSFSFAEWAKQYTHNGEFMCSLMSVHYLTIILRARVGYEMIGSQQGGIAPSWL